MYQGVTFLPAIFGILKSSCEKINDRLNWLPPLFTYSSSCESSLAEYMQPIDVLAISCYEWNWDFQLEFAELVKSKYPNCLVIAGGPQPDWKDSNFFIKFPYIDAVVKGEPEDVFPKIIEHWLNQKTLHQELVGVWTNKNSAEQGTKNVVRSTQLPSDSPYVSNETVYSHLLQNMDKGKNPNLWVTWETNRGCPYQCVFCDWGSSTYSRVREVDFNRIKSEIRWFAKQKIETIYITDANFGILERDLEITKLAAETKAEFGFPKTIFFNPAKNNPGRLVEIYKILHENKLLNYCLQNNLQSTQADVLKVMKRIDVGAEKQMHFIKDIYKTGIHMGAALIMGNPGETLSSFKSSLFDILEWGIHSEIRIFPWALLPNAPAADPKFIEQNKIITIERPTMRNAVGKDVAKSKFSGKSKYLVSHSKMSQQDWVEANLYSTFFLVFHCFGVSRFTSLFLKKSNDVSYANFYESLYEDYFKVEFADLMEHLHMHFETYLSESDAIINLDFKPELDIQIDPEAWLFLSLMTQKQRLTTTFKAYLLKQYQSQCIDDLVNFNMGMIIDPDYDSNRGRSFTIRYNWPSYFNKAEDPEVLTLAEPLKESALVTIDQKGTGPYLDIPFDFELCQGAKRLIVYNHRVIGQKSSRHLRTYFQSQYLKVNLLTLRQTMTSHATTHC